MKALTVLDKPPKSYGDKILGFDCETEGPYNNFYMGSVYNGKDFFIFYDKKEMCDFMLSRDNHNYRFFATNLQFDLSCLFYPFLDKDHWELFFISSRMIYGKYKKDKRTWFFNDTLNLATNQSVEKLGKMLKLPKINKPSFLGHKPKNESERIELEEYNKRDSEITYKFAVYFNDTIVSLGGQLHNTIAGCGLDLYRRKYMPKEFIRPPKQLLLLMYDAYYGGRTEVFKVGYSEKKHYYDINSLYPYVMQNAYPDINTMHFSNHPTIDLLDYEGISNVDMYCPYMEIPYLPIRLNKRVIFPCGNISGTYSNFEIRKAIELGYQLKSLNWTICYTDTFYPFKEFVDDLYTLRMKYSKEGNKLMKYSIKILMNSLYGKWGVKIDKSDTGLFQPIDYETFDYNKYDDVTVVDTYSNEGYHIGSYMIKKLTHIPLYANPILAIYTTAYARDTLYNYITSCNDVVYCDTDSIITNDTLNTSEKLGDVKLEYNIEKGWFLYPKAYRIIGTNEDNEAIDSIKWKGIPEKSRAEFWANDFFVEFDKIIKLRESVVRGLPANSIIKTHKSLKEIWHKRKLVKEDIDIISEYSDTIPISI